MLGIPPGKPETKRLRFFTDDYPRASLSVMSTFLILSTLLDLLFDPLVATLTDGTRKIFGRAAGMQPERHVIFSPLHPSSPTPKNS